MLASGGLLGWISIFLGPPGLDLAGFRYPEFPGLGSGLLGLSGCGFWRPPGPPSGLDSRLLSWGLFGWILASAGFLLGRASWARKSLKINGYHCKSLKINEKNWKCKKNIENL